jgi:hypothetical protein
MTSGISHPIGNLEAAPLENGEVPANPRFWCTGRTWSRIINSSRTIDSTPTCSTKSDFPPPL